MTRAPAGVLRSQQVFVRAACVALLLAGLVGMHGLAHHQQDGPAAAASGVTLLAAPHGQAHALIPGRPAPSAQLPGRVSSAASLTPNRHCDDSCDDSGAALCVALLTATGLLLLAARRLRRLDPVPTSRGAAPVGNAPMRGPPDPVRVLCVSRT